MSDSQEEQQRRNTSDPSPADSEDSAPLLQEAESGLSAVGEEAAPETVSAETQTAVLADAAVQYEPPGAGADEDALAEQLQSLELADFLAAAAPRCEAALQQNELLDALGDELAALADEEGGETGGAGALAGRSAVAGLAELHSFSDLLHSKGRTLQAVAWHPGKRGVVAVACTHQLQQQADGVQGSGAVAAGGGSTSGAAPPAGGRPAAASHAPLASARQEPRASAAAASLSPAAHLRQPPPGCILVWNHADPIHPEAVLQPPAEALAFAFHPVAPHAWLAAGLATGQVALFNLQQATAASAAAAAPGGSAGVAGAGAASTSQQQQHKQQRADKPGTDEGRDEGSRSAVLLPAFVSLPDSSHQAAVTDLQWLPGAMVTRDGRLEACAAPGTEGPSSTSSGAAAASAAATAADACTLFATTAADGSLLLWDMRITTRQRKAGKDEEAPDWKPALALHPPKNPLMATRFCRDLRSGVGRFLLGSLEGELAVVDACPPPQEHKTGPPEWVLSAVQQTSGHTGRVLTLAFSPFFSDTLLVVGDSGFVVWHVASGGGDSNRDAAAAAAAALAAAVAGDASGGAGGGEELCKAVFESPFCASALYTCGCWSPTKPGVVIMGRADGRLEAWDLLDRSHQAAMVAPVAPCALTALAPSPAATGASGRPAPQVLAVGDAAGTLRLLELPRALRRRGHAEVKAMGALLAREQERLAEVLRRAEARAAEARAAADRQRAEAAAAAQGAARRQQQEAAAARAGQQVVGVEEEGADAAERRYLALEAEWREKLLGLVGAGAGAEAAVAGS